MIIRIGVLGIGGVGGYFGGLLAAKYKDSDNIEIIFITKSETEKVIIENGLKLIIPDEEQTIFPDFVTSNTNEIGTLDVLIVTVKSYDLLDSIAKVSSAIQNHTIILPLLNGVDAKSKIENIYPNNLVLDGCVFIISKIIEKGVIKVMAGKGVLYFGSTKKDRRLEELNQLFLDASINAKYTADIQKVIWGKYLFISSLASLTSYLNVTTGEIFKSENYKGLLIQLLKEFKAIADAKNIILSDTIVEDTLSKMESLPYKTTTSMQRDCQQNKKTEYKSLTKHIVELGDELNVSTPIFNLILKDFERKELKG